MPKPYMTERSYFPDHYHIQLPNWLSKYGFDSERFEHHTEGWILGQNLTMPQPPLHQVLTDGVCPDDNINDDNVFVKMMANT